MKCRLAVATIALVAFGLSQSGKISAADDLTQPIRVSPDGHFLVQPDGKPFFWLQDWGYELFKLPSREAADAYLKDRASKGFNIIMAPAMGFFRPLVRPNPYGELPFIGNDPRRPNPRYFDHVDWIIDRAAHYGIRVVLLPSWGGPIAGGFGGDQQIFNVENAEHYARWLGARYKGKNVLWSLGGDMNPIWPKVAVRSLAGEEEDQAKTTKVLVDYRPVFDAFAKGIEDGNGGKTFITYHPTGSNWPDTPEARTSLYLGERPWLDMNMIQSGAFVFPDVREKEGGFAKLWNTTLNYELIRKEYDSTPVRPIVDGEPLMEDEAINYDPANGYFTAYHSRNSAYHALFAGAAGVAYFNVAAGLLSKDDPFLKRLQLEHPRALSSPGSMQMQFAKALMLSRPYFTRIPDQSVIIGDHGRGFVHVGATRDREGSYAMVYLPNGLSVTVDLTKISGKAVVGWWFDPRTGKATSIDGIFPTMGGRTFTPPSSGADIDWVLVLDDKARKFKAPGTPLGEKTTA